MTLKNAHQFIALEGPAFAGKTTILKYLHHHYHDLFCVVPEASEYLGGDKHFPHVPFPSFDLAKSSSYFFLEMEHLRCKEAQKVAKSNPKKTVILDRSTLLSSVLFYSLLEEKFPEIHNFSESFTQHALELFDAELKVSSFFIPEKLILIKPKNRSVFESRLSRGTKNTMFGHWFSATFLVNEYMKVINSHFTNKALILETENTEENLHLNSKKIIDFLSVPVVKSTTSTIFSEYQGKKVPHIFIPNVKQEKKMYSSAIKKVHTLIKRTACQIH